MDRLNYHIIFAFVFITIALVIISVFFPFFGFGVLAGSLDAYFMIWYFMPIYEQWQSERRKKKIAELEYKLKELKAKSD